YRDLGKGRVGRHEISGAIKAARGQVIEKHGRNRVRANAADARRGGNKNNIIVRGADQNASDGASGEDVIVAAILIERTKKLRRGISVFDQVNADAEEAIGGEIAFAGAHYE